MRLQPLLCLGIDHRPDMGGGIARVADRKFARGARDHLDHAVGDVVLHEQQPQRRAALAGGAERRRHDIVGDLLGQCGGIDDHRIDAAGFRDQRHDRAVLGGERAVDRSRDLGRAGEDDAGHVGMRHQRRADGPVARHQMQRGGGHAGLVQQADGLGRDQRRLLGGLCHHRIAGHQRRRDLAHEDRQRKIPRRYRDEHAAAAQPQAVALAGRPRHRFVRAEQLAAFGGVVAAEIDGLAHFRERVVEGLAALALQQRDEMRRALLQQIGGALQDFRAALCRRPAPGRKSLARGGDRLRCTRSGVASMTLPTIAAGSIGLTICRAAPAMVSPSMSGAAATGAVSAAIAASSSPNAARSPNSMPREFWRCG